MRYLPLIAALALTVAIPATAAAGPTAGETAAESDHDGPVMRVGSEWVAQRDVRLRDATLAKGSRVKVVHVTSKRGTTVAVDLELKDGHVLRAVDYRIVRDAFTPAKK